MAVDHYFRHYILPADPAERDRHVLNWGERIVTGIAVSIGLLIVVAVALLMGMT